MDLCLNHRCPHHLEIDKQDEANHQARQTYRNPTEREAINNVMRATRNHKKEER